FCHITILLYYRFQIIPYYPIISKYLKTPISKNRSQQGMKNTEIRIFNKKVKPIFQKPATMAFIFSINSLSVISKIPLRMNNKGTGRIAKRNNRVPPIKGILKVSIKV